MGIKLKKIETSPNTTLSVKEKVRETKDWKPVNLKEYGKNYIKLLIPQT